MLDSDSGSSELSDASSLSSDSSSGSEADVKKERPQSTALRNKQPSPLNKKPSHPNSQRKERASLSLSSGSGSDGGSDTDLSSSGDDGDNGVPRLKKSSKSSKNSSNPISLSDSTPVYSQEIMDRSMMLSPSNVKYDPRSHTSTTNRGKGRSQGKGLLPNHGPFKYGTANSVATTIDFEDGSASIGQNSEIPQKATNLASIPHAPVTPNMVRKKKESSTEQTKQKSSKSGSGSNSKQKSGSRKVGRPKSVSKDVYCICREPYDGVEFMIACDRCEEWFHGRCIGMKPHEAKKSSHYYCDTCQKIRRVFGVATISDEASKPLKSKVRSKKKSQKQDGEQNPNKELPESEEKSFPIKLKAKLGSTNAPSSIYSPKDSTLRQDQGMNTTLREIQKSTQPQSVHIESRYEIVEKLERKPADEAGLYSSHNDTHSVNTPASVPIQPSYNIKPQDRASQDDDEEDICPICDFECTCSKGQDSAVEQLSTSVKPKPIIDDGHALTAIKVPFQPFPRAEPTMPTDPHETKHRDSEGRRSFFDAEKRPVVVLKAGMQGRGSDDEFRTSAKNPMAVPTGQQRTSVNMRSSGKNIGKYTKSSKFNMSTYHRSNFDSESGESSESDGHEGEIGNQVNSRARYEIESDEADDIADLHSLSSSDDLEAIPERFVEGSSQRFGNGDKINLGKKWLQTQSSSSKSKGHEVVKKRGPGRPKKKKDPLIISPEDEIALYTPASTSRKLTSPKLVGGIIRAAVNAKSRAEYPVITFDPDVAEDVMALNALGDSDEQSDDGEIAENIVFEQMEGDQYESFSETDLLEDGDLSDELSGELSDIMSDDFDGFSEESMDLTSSDEEDETDSSHPREFNYSDMEEQDESLVDSDSSPNSDTSDSSDSSGTDPGSDSDEDDIIPYEHEELEDSIDEEELQLLQEQERILLSKAHGLLDVFSEEDSDPDRNPFESSDEDEENDERESDDDGDDEGIYSDEYYEGEQEVEEMDEQEIIARLKGMQSDLQALLMIPAEQQEQLLLLQHYEETHRQQQGQQVDISGDQFQSSQISQIENQQLDPSQNIQIPDLPEPPSFLPQFDINVPDLDAVSRQLAASIAENIAKSMAEANETGEGSSIFPATSLGENIPIQLENISSFQDTGIHLDLASGMPWNTPIPSSPTIPTPTNTPTPPGMSIGVSPFVAGSSEVISNQNGEPVIPQPIDSDQLPISVSKFDGETIHPTSPHLVPQLRSEVSESIARLTIDAPDNISEDLGEEVDIDSSQNDVPTSNTLDLSSVTKFQSFELGKRKEDSLGSSEIEHSQGKRRRLSNTTLKEGSGSDFILNSFGSTTVQLPKESIIPSVDESPTSSNVDSSSSFNTTPTADADSTVYNFSKASMPFIDPSAKIFDSVPRRFRNSLKGKETRNHIELMPMDDLLDTSALYGRPSSRSPSPNRSGNGGDDETSQSALKDLNRWQRVPIGTFRKSRRPSSPYVGIKDALKSGSVIMPTTLLEDHQQHQRQLLQESQHRLRKKSSSSKKHRSASLLSSDLRQGSISGDLNHHHYRLSHGEKVRRRRRVMEDSSHQSINRLMSKSGESSIHSGLGIGLGDLSTTPSSKSGSDSSRRRSGNTIDHVGGMEVLKDLMTDSSQLPSSACPTPLHSPLFSATAAGGGVLHHTSGEPISESNGGIKKMDGLGNNDTEPQIEDSIISHLDLDIGKEMDGFHERQLAKSKALKDEK